jgi:SAM-dependent methyltransferase
MAEAIRNAAQGNINANNIRIALEYLRGLSRKPLDPGYLSEDFGPQSTVARQCIAALWEALNIPSQKSTLLYEEWKHLFGQVSGYEREQLPDIAQLAHEYRLSTIQDMPRLLFTIHTYYALIIKLLAAEILTLVRQGIEQSFVERIAMSTNDALQQALRKMEDGGVFRDLQIENLLEGDFFSWYLDQWNPTLAEAIHHMLITLQHYEPGTTLLAPNKVKDLLKRLYQHLIPASLRHDLGEYYTPDWLAEWVLNKVDYDGTLHKRILDPSCGTGTFLVQAINRAKEKARSENLADETVLQAILQNVVGFDLNPLAVVAARTNYILALGDLLAAQTSPVVIPIFLSDSFASASVGEFDIIAGNPPWLRWTRLPISYRETIKDYCVSYGLFSQDTYVGGIETDISTIVTYSATEKWLKNGGILGFLLPQTVFKNESSEGFRKFILPEGTGLQVIEAHDMSELKPFGNVANKTSALFLRKGAVTSYPIPYFIWEKSQKTPLRQDMTLAQVQAITQQVSWSATPIYPNGGPWLTMESQLLPTAQRMIGKSGFQAHKGITSDLNGVYWIHVLEKRADDSLRFRNLHAVGKHAVAPFEGLIEAGVVFPLARGLDAKPFFVEASSTYVIVPQNSMRGYPEVHMRQTYRKALDYFRLYKQQLEARSSYQRYHTTRNGKELGPYYSLWNVGPYSFTDHKVVWREVQNPRQFFVSYLGPRNDPFLGEVPVIPDHKLYFVPCTSADEAHFLNGFLNSLAVRAFVAGYAINTQIATHITEYINIPVFDASNRLHVELSQVSSTIHAERRSATETELADIERIVEHLLARD